MAFSVKSKQYELIDVFESSSGSKVYELRWHEDGVVYCTCPGWKFAKGELRKKRCKHMKQFSEQHPVAARRLGL